MPSVVAPSMKVTVPVGVALPESGLTVAVKVRLVPLTAVVAEAVSAVVVAIRGPGLTGMEIADEVLALTRDLVKRTGCGFLVVTHSARLAATLDRQVHLSAGLIA